MQEQIMKAAGIAAKAGFAESGAAPNAARQPGSRILAAMFKANAGACDCEVCQLLRREVQSLFDSFLQAGEEAAEEGPPAEAAAAVTGTVETPANA